jgi:hypothetical protein
VVLEQSQAYGDVVDDAKIGIDMNTNSNPTTAGGAM